MATRINRNGLLRVSAQRHRSQAANREQTIERFAELLRDALAERPGRRKTRIPKRSRQRRLASKKHRARKKQWRSKVDPTD